MSGEAKGVRSKALANYVIATPQGNILINSDLEANVPMIRTSIEKLGFKFEDTKILLISYAHLDHGPDTGYFADQNPSCPNRELSPLG